MGWSSLGGHLASGAAAASWGTEETQVFAIQGDGDVWNRYWDGERWHEWESLGGAFTGQPAASARDANRIDVFAVGTDRVLRHRWWNGEQWVPWEAVAGAPEGGRAVACSWIGGRLDLFVWGMDDELWYSALATEQ
jgi:hypothetical protein